MRDVCDHTIRQHADNHHATYHGKLAISSYDTSGHRFRKADGIFDFGRHLTFRRAAALHLAFQLLGAKPGLHKAAVQGPHKEELALFFFVILVIVVVISSPRKRSAESGQGHILINDRCQILNFQFSIRPILHSAFCIVRFPGRSQVFPSGHMTNP